VAKLSREQCEAGVGPELAAYSFMFWGHYLAFNPSFCICEKNVIIAPEYKAAVRMQQDNTDEMLTACYINYYYS
jgi:hypothetical protein